MPGLRGIANDLSSYTVAGAKCSKKSLFTAVGGNRHFSTLDARLSTKSSGVRMGGTRPWIVHARASRNRKRSELIHCSWCKTLEKVTFHRCRRESTFFDFGCSAEHKVIWGKDGRHSALDCTCQGFEESQRSELIHCCWCKTLEKVTFH